MAVLASITLPALAAAAASGLVGGAVLGLIFGVTRGLGAAVQNLTLRLLLAAYRVAPLHYPSWLDHAVDLGLLYRGANGGYLFIHRMVQDYFGRRSAPPDLMPRPGVGVITGLR